MSAQKAVRFLLKDPKLGKIIRQTGDYKIKITKNKYQSLIDAIINQQLTGSAAKSIMEKFRRLYYPKFPKPIDVINTPPSKLRSAGLSRMKIKYIKELSKKIEQNHVNFKKFSGLTNEQVIEELTKIKGIGRWTAEMFLIFSLGRLDVLPVDDLGLRKGIKLLFSFKELPDAKQIRMIAERWRPYRTVATWYIWKSLKKFDSIG